MHNNSDTKVQYYRRSSSLDRRLKNNYNGLFPVISQKKLHAKTEDSTFVSELQRYKYQITDDSTYVPELQRYKYQFKSYLNKKRQRWYESLGPASADVSFFSLRHSHDNVNLLRDYELEEKIHKHEKTLEHKKKMLTEMEINLNQLVVEVSDKMTVQLINEAEEKQKQNETLATNLLQLKETLSLLERSIENKRTMLEDVSTFKSFTLTILEDKQIPIESVDFKAFFTEFDERLKRSVSQSTLKSMQIQKLEKQLSAQTKHWIHDIDNLNGRRNYLLSQISKEKTRLTWLKQTLEKFTSESL